MRLADMREAVDNYSTQLARYQKNPDDIIVQHKYLQARDKIYTQFDIAASIVLLKVAEAAVKQENKSEDLQNALAMFED